MKWKKRDWICGGRYGELWVGRIPEELRKEIDGDDGGGDDDDDDDDGGDNSADGADNSAGNDGGNNGGDGDGGDRVKWGSEWSVLVVEKVRGREGKAGCGFRYVY